MWNHTGKYDTSNLSYIALYGEMNDEKPPVSHSNNNEGPYSCLTSEGTYTVGLHILAIFVIFIASCIGTVLPLLGKYLPILNIHPFAIILGKCISSGVVMSVAMVHMLNHGMHGFMKDCVPSALKESFDAYSLLFAMVAALLMQMLEVQMNILLDKWVHSDAINSSPTGHETSVFPALEEGETPQERTPIADNSAPIMLGCHNHGVIYATRINSARRMASAIFMEFGLALHSVFLGIAVGIANDSETRSLLVALTFHQIFEGLALGSRLADATMSRCMEVVLIFIYAVSVPLGTIIGVITVNGADVSMTSSTFITLQAVFDSICGGILLYLGFTLILIDFPEDLRAFAGASATHRGWRVFGMYAALWFGAGIMTLLGKWA